MPKRRNGTGAESAALMALRLDAIVEPELPARERMADDKMAELVESMGELGQLQPIGVVRRVIAVDGSGERVVSPESPDAVRRSEAFEIVWGHRRYIAARQLGWETLKAVIFDTRDLSLEAARAHENLVREDLNAAEEAIWYQQLREQHSLDEAGLCKLVKRSPDYIADRFRLLRGDETVFEAVRDGRINMGVGRELNKITDQAMRRYYLEQAIRSGTSHRVVAQWVSDWKAQGSPAAAPAPEPEAPAEPGAPAPYKPTCEFCGGDKDPYNLVSVMIHRWELEAVRKALSAPVVE